MISISLTYCLLYLQKYFKCKKVILKTEELGEKVCHKIKIV